jgi:hypothetical protein
MFHAFATSVGFYRCAEQDKSARNQTDQIKYKNKRTQIQSKSEEAVEEQVNSEQDHSDSFHVVVFWFFPVGCNRKNIDLGSARASRAHTLLLAISSCTVLKAERYFGEGAEIGTRGACAPQNYSVFRYSIRSRFSFSDNLVP